jgi:hypothetical protein
MVTISAALEKVKADLPSFIQDHVATYLAEHPDRKRRRRKLGPLQTVLLFITQVMHGNTAITHLRWLSDMTCSATAYCQARLRLPLALFEYLCEQVTRFLLPECQEVLRWRGHRVWRGDGTSFSMPDTKLLQKTYGQPPGQKEGCGFPVATLLVLCNAAGLIVKALALPLRTHDASQLSKLYDQMQTGDLLVYDRAGCSYAHLALIFQRNLHAIFRMHQRQKVSFRPGRKHARQLPRDQRKGVPTSQWIQRLGPCDQIVRWFKPTSRPRWMDATAYALLPQELVLRELRYRVRQRGFRTRWVTLVTTLLDPKLYPAAELAEQYADRWQIETDFRHLKQTMKMDTLKCKTPDGVLKELLVFVLVYNLVRLVMLQAAKRQNVPLDRISFVDALRWLCAVRDGAELLDLIVNPKREGRVEPRVIKRRAKKYPLMKRPRKELRKALCRKGVAA